MARPDEQTPGTEAGPPPDVVTFGLHVVTLIDFLGQAGELMRWDSLPDTPEKQTEFLDAVRKTFGRIMKWRDLFTRDVNPWSTPRPAPAWVVNPDPRDVETYKQFQELDLGVMQFSDTIVLYAPIENLHGFSQVSGICVMIINCGMRMLAALAQEIPFRGAIEIGMAARFPQTDLYGPALAKAHYLESKVADYPRIVVGSTLIDYLNAQLRNPENDGPARVNRAFAQRCLDLISKDHDGCAIIDYLGVPFTALGRNPNRDGGEEIKQLAFSFVTSELERFRREGNKKLAQRYERLAAYFASRGVSIV